VHGNASSEFHRNLCAVILPDRAHFSISSLTSSLQSFRKAFEATCFGSFAASRICADAMMTRGNGLVSRWHSHPMLL
jgi:hypothetical protein